jgi:ferritin-like metal-binding protein YciE
MQSEDIMVIKEPKELFVKILSNLREHEYGLTDTLNTLRENIQDLGTKEYFESLAYLSEKNVETIDKCFKMINEKPVKTDDKLKELFLEDFKKEFNEIQSPLAKVVYFVAKANHLMNVKAGEWTTLIAMSDVSGNRGVGVLLESCFAQKLAFIKRARRRIRALIEEEIE